MGGKGSLLALQLILICLISVQKLFYRPFIRCFMIKKIELQVFMPFIKAKLTLSFGGNTTFVHSFGIQRCAKTSWCKLHLLLRGQGYLVISKTWTTLSL